MGRTHLINIEECIANGQVRKNHQVDLPKQLPCLYGVNLFMKGIRVVEESHGSVPIRRRPRLPPRLEMILIMCV